MIRSKNSAAVNFVPKRDAFRRTYLPQLNDDTVAKVSAMWNQSMLRCTNMCEQLLKKSKVQMETQLLFSRWHVCRMLVWWLTVVWGTSPTSRRSSTVTTGIQIPAASRSPWPRLLRTTSAAILGGNSALSDILRPLSQSIHDMERRGARASWIYTLCSSLVVYSGEWAGKKKTTDYLDESKDKVSSRCYHRTLDRCWLKAGRGFVWCTRFGMDHWSIYYS